MNSYELTIIFYPEALADAKKLLEDIKKMISVAKGIVNRDEEWGERPLAYPILKLTKGVYHYMELSLPASDAGRVMRKLETDEKVVRYLLIKKDEKVIKKGKAGK